MASILFLGLLIGMKHALEADHVAAVAAMATRESTVARTVRLGLIWGLGHTLTLFAFAAAVLIFRWGAAADLAHLAEVLVGVLLVALGVDVLWRLWRDRVHFHLHNHGGDRHLHAHSHQGERAQVHDASAHNHRHVKALPLRALLIGLMHGMAGSAALVLLTLDQTPSIAVGLAYIALFGVGSMFGMALLSWALSWPLRAGARAVTGAYGLLNAGVGATTLGLGLWTLGHGAINVMAMV